MRILTICFALAVLTSSASAAEVAADKASGASTISNKRLRRDTDGNIVDAHDGCLQKFGDRYYLYGTAYGTTDGFNKNNRYHCYSSADLIVWKYEGELLKNPPDGVYYRPYVVYNKKTAQYVLWYNWYAILWEGQYGVATSSTPQGPFVIHDGNVKVAHKKPGDESLLVDDDGTAYLIYTSIASGHSISVEKLAPDYLSSTQENSGFLGKGCEAPALFRREQTYYALFDTCCCFGPAGSGAQLHTAEKPLGPYKHRGNINRDAAGKPIIAAQQTWVAQLPTSHGTVYVWMGDRWGSRPDGVKGHDFQFWSRPLEFTADGNIQPLQWDSNIGDKDFNKPRTAQRLALDKIVIESATYGDLASKNPARIRDVKAKVEQALRKGGGRLTVSSMAEGDDPCYGTVKTLKITYQADGRALTYTGTDPEIADLLDPE
ncbi:MAG: family 43 glycosylhydrolase [Planctomycetota bacterium]